MIILILKVLLVLFVWMVISHLLVTVFNFSYAHSLKFIDELKKKPEYKPEYKPEPYQNKTELDIIFDFLLLVTAVIVIIVLLLYIGITIPLSSF